MTDANKWVAVAERLPAAEEQVLMYIAYGVVIGYVDAAGKWFIQDQAANRDDEICDGIAGVEHDFELDDEIRYPPPSHWMPLPDAPN